MRTAYELALNHFSLNLGDSYIKENEANNQETVVGIGNSIGFYDIHNFDDGMHIDTPISRNYRHGFSFESHDEKFYDFFDFFPPLDPSAGIGTWSNDADVAANVAYASTAYYVGYKTVKNSLENVTKGMLLALLDGDSKRTSTVGIGSTSEKLKIFFNTLGIGSEGRDTTLKPWGGPNAFNTTHSTITGITSISRLNNVATVILNSNHGLDTNYDDWGAVLEVTGINTTSFSISTTTYPNGVPIVLTSNNSFTYRNIGLNTSHTSGITGTIDVKVGWGGTSNNLHLHFD
tara:strand:- start:588 stop:1454 length:867 start_codon:yes stop_codon:yes gene_type:complete